MKTNIIAWEENMIDDMGKKIIIRLDPQDEYMHPLEEAKNYNESMYFNVFDASETPLGGWFRLGNRANERYAEMSCCIYLPDGSVGFMYKRPEISDNDAFDAGGMKFEVLEPFKKIKVTFDGKICLLKKPFEMANPKKAFTENPMVKCRVEIDYTGVSPMYGGEPVNEDGSQIEQKAEEAFARGHYEQHIHGKGFFVVGMKNTKSTDSDSGIIPGARGSGRISTGTAGCP